MGEMIADLRFHAAAAIAETLSAWSSALHPNKYEPDYIIARLNLLAAEHADQFAQPTHEGGEP